MSMLRELPMNALPLRGQVAGISGKSATMLAASAQRLPDSESEEDLEDYGSSEEDNAPAVPQPQQRGTLRRLVRAVDAAPPSQSRRMPEPRPSGLEDDLLDGLANLGLGSRGPTAVPASAFAPAAPLRPGSDAAEQASLSQRAAAPAAAASSAPSAPAPRPSAPRGPPSPDVILDSDYDDGDGSDGVEDLSDDDDDGNELSDDDGDQPFFERIAPSAEAITKAAAASTAASGAAAAPVPGSMVLASMHPQRQQYVLGPAVALKLFPHQVQGVKWLWNLFDMQRGGILGDDMGLGKTMQCAAFLAGLFASRLVRRALIIAPKTLLPHWNKELEVCGLRSLTREFFGSSESERAAALRATINGRGVVVTTYGMVQHNADQLAGPAPGRRGGGGGEAEDFTWDLILLDEGHKIKNPKMKLVEELHKLPARVRVIISGTPIQNNLMEMHSLFDFTTEGLLGDARTFKKNYEKPITKGLDKQASARDRQTGAAIAAELRQRVEPFFLRREKKDVLPDNSGDRGAAGAAGADGGPSTSAAAGAAPHAGARAQGLPRKNDLVVWLRLTPLQRKIYNAFLHTDSVRQVLSHTASPLAAITVLKKVCDHPALLSQRAAASVISGAHRWAKDGKGSGGGTGGRRRTSLDDFIVNSDEEDDDDEGGGDDGSVDCTSGGEDDEAGAGSSVDDLPAGWLGDGGSMDAELTRELEQRGAEGSCKSAFVLALLERLAAEGHRTLIFSQSKVMLSILEAGVKNMKLAYCRIDGDIASAEERQSHVARFQNSKNIPVFLLTSQVGGLGLTLTAADRVIIVDPAWNPSVDNQSVDRAYRMGQTRDVVVYRLITCGTVEEKIYRKQVFKGGLSRTGTEEGIQFRYFTQTDLRDLFSVTPEGLQTSATQVQLNDMHRHQRTATPELERHLASMMRMDGVAGIHDHNLLFSQRPQEVAPTAQEGAAILNQMNKCAPGVDALSDMMSTGMRLGAAIKSQAERDQARRKVEEIAGRITSTRATIAVSAGMKDGGAKLLERKAQLEEEYAQAVAALAALEATTSCNAPGALGSSGAGGNSSSGAGGSSNGGAGGNSSGGAGGNSSNGAGGKSSSGAGGDNSSGAGGNNNSGAGGNNNSGAAAISSSSGSRAGLAGNGPTPGATTSTGVGGTGSRGASLGGIPPTAPQAAATGATLSSPSGAAQSLGQGQPKPLGKTGLGFGAGAARRAAASSGGLASKEGTGGPTERNGVPSSSLSSGGNYISPGSPAHSGAPQQTPSGCVGPLARHPGAAARPAATASPAVVMDGGEDSISYFSANSSVVTGSGIGAGGGAGAADDEVTSKCIDLTLSP